jgi:hypothetical protein
MRLNEILIEQQLDEKPMGFLSKWANKLTPTNAATGRLQSGKEANELKKEFQIFLGQSRQKAEPEVLIKWLATKGYPTKGAEAEMQKATTGQVIGKALGKGVKAVGKGIAAVGKGAANVAKGAVAGAKAANPAPAPVDKNFDKTQRMGNFGKVGMQTASVDFTNKESIMEALSGGQLDNIFLRAVGDKYAQQGGVSKKGTGSAPADAQQGGALGVPGAIDGVKQGFTGNKPAAAGTADANTASTAGDKPQAVQTPAAPTNPAKQEPNNTAAPAATNAPQAQTPANTTAPAEPQAQANTTPPKAAAPAAQTPAEPQAAATDAPQAAATDAPQAEPAAEPTTQAAPKAAPAVQLPRDIQTQIDKLDAKQKQELLGML